MKQLLGNEKGYTLLLTVLVSTIFVMLASGLLMATYTGATRTELRQDFTQATELAEKGTMHISHKITSALEKEIKAKGGLLGNEFISRLNALLNEYKCTGGKKVAVQSDTGAYETCILAIDPEVDANGKENPYRKIVTFQSTGISAGKQRQITYKMKIGSSNIPNALNYALGTNILCTQEEDCLPGEGNMYLHGAVEVSGDMKVDGHLITSDRARILLKGEQFWAESLLPAIKPTPNTNAQKAKIVLGKEIYTFSPNHAFDYENHVAGSYLGTNVYTKLTDHLEQAFHPSGTPNIVVRYPIVEDIKISELKDQFRYSKGPGVTTVSPENGRFHSANYKGKKVYAQDNTISACGIYNSSSNCTKTETNSYIFTGNNRFGAFSTDHSVFIKGTSQLSIENGMYVGGNLYIGNQAIKDLNIPVSEYDKIEIDGTIFVDGDLFINGADAQLNALIYVTGDADIQYSVIKGLKKHGKDGQLIIFAEGNIKISNNSLYQDHPSDIDGFFYSKQAFEMYGVGSNVKINGGISARRIVLNAIRGEARNKCEANCNASHFNQYNNFFYSKKSYQENKPSRLQIIYNPEIIETYSDLKKEEPRIDKVDPPRVIERSAN